MCNPAATFCALIERQLPRTWRWAAYGVEDIPRAEGSAPTRTAARRGAVKALVALGRQGLIELPRRKFPEPALITGLLPSHRPSH